MFQNYIKTAWRNIVKNRLFSVINILGLSVGMTLLILIFLYIQHETSYNQTIPQQGQVYRIYKDFHRADGRKSAILPAPVSPAVMAEIPEVRSASRFSGIDEILVQVGEQSLFIEGFATADSLFFQTVPLALSQGDKNRVFSKPGNAVLSADMAKILFGNENPIGQAILINNEQQVTVEGVLAAPQGPSHFNAINLLVNEHDFSPHWTGGHCEVYVQLSDNTVPQLAEQKITALANDYIKQAYLEDGETPPERFPQWRLQPLTAIHLHSTNMGGYHGNNGSIRQIGILLSLGFIVLLIASINYMNLATARATKRAKEVGIRKVSGATFKQMVSQFLSESVLQSVMALCAAVVLADLALPYFSRVVDRPLDFFDILRSNLPIWLTLLAFCIGILAGSYPAFYLSQFRPISTLKGVMVKGKTGNRFRQSLVVLQFSLSITLIIMTGFVWKQVNYMLHQDLGFNGAQVVVATLNTAEAVEKFRRTKGTLLNQPGILSSSVVSRTPGQFIPNYTMNLESKEKEAYINTFFGDAGLAETLSLEMLEGRFFSEKFPRDTASAFVVNQQFLKTYGIENPIGYRLKFAFDETYGEIIGVVKDFHYQGLQSELAPLVISAREDIAWFSHVSFKIDPTLVSTAISQMEGFWKTLEPKHPFRYSFLDEDFARQYDTYERYGNIIALGTLLSIFVAILGLFGLSTFTIEQRTKEIGIRKVLGATVDNLIQLLIKDFIKLVLIAGMVALPIGYWFVDSWLADFAYPTALGPLPFALALFSAVLLAVLTVMFQTIRSSRANPVEALRYE
ncbi:MAG: ABC transporter permease [Saprospiraceae bacterium]